MQVYAFDLVPWPYLKEPSYYPDPNSLYDPARGKQVYDEHLAQMELYEALGFDAVSIVGDPDYVVREIQSQMRELGTGVFIGLFNFGSMPHEMSCRNIRLFGERVLPELKRA